MAGGSRALWSRIGKNPDGDVKPFAYPFALLSAHSFYFSALLAKLIHSLARFLTHFLAPWEEIFDHDVNDWISFSFNP